MKKIKITCTDTEKTAEADIIKESDKELIVALVGSNIRLVLKRKDIRKPYIGYYNSMEFYTKG